MKKLIKKTAYYVGFFVLTSVILNVALVIVMLIHKGFVSG